MDMITQERLNEMVRKTVLVKDGKRIVGYLTSDKDSEYLIKDRIKSFYSTFLFIK